MARAAQVGGAAAGAPAIGRARTAAAGAGLGSAGDAVAEHRPGHRRHGRGLLCDARARHGQPCAGERHQRPRLGPPRPRHPLQHCRLPAHAHPRPQRPSRDLRQSGEYQPVLLLRRFESPPAKATSDTMQGCSPACQRMLRGPCVCRMRVRRARGKCRGPSFGI